MPSGIDAIGDKADIAQVQGDRSMVQLLKVIADTAGAVGQEFDWDTSDPTDPLLIYVGQSEPGSSAQTSVNRWRIKKFVYSGSELVRTLWANGNANYVNIWDNRAALSYS